MNQTDSTQETKAHNLYRDLPFMLEQWQETILRDRIADLLREHEEMTMRCAELSAERERIYRDALIVLSQFTATPEEGYDDAPHCLVMDIERLGKERDDLKAKVQALEKALREVLNHPSLPSTVRQIANAALAGGKDIL